MFQSYAFQVGAFQTPINDNNPSGNGGYFYQTPYQKHREEIELQEKVKREKTELEKLESVIAENKRKAELAAQNRLKAQARQAANLARLEAEFLAEINRLSMVRAALIKSIKENEAILILLIVMKRRRLRVA